jgi:sugar phosphate isomerase/epimerase
LYENGTLSSGIGWQIPRLPGLGHVEWSTVFSALHRVGYNGSIIIEHEDRDFEETEALVKRGFLIARDVLSPYVH